MTDQELNEIKERCDKATPGEWFWDVINAHKDIALESRRYKVMDFVRYGTQSASPRFRVNGIMERADTLSVSIPGMEHHRGFDDYINHPDADFIAHSRTDVPALLAEIERLKDTHKALESSLCNAEMNLEHITANYKAIRNELCLKCGKYREAHLGSCDGCRWESKNG